ncbi:DUF58 domain-containing protein, partial [Zafaria sp. J156]|nr:DUF58 domain-containing protein [Zafaria sp. J156]
MLPVLLFPSGWTVGAVLLVLAGLACADAALAPSPRSLRIERAMPRSVRLGERATARLFVRNTGPRRFRGTLRDGWQPSAGARATRFALDVPPGERRAVPVELAQKGRGESRVLRTTPR